MRDFNSGIHLKGSDHQDDNVDKSWTDLKQTCFVVEFIVARIVDVDIMIHCTKVGDSILPDFS